MSRRSQRVLSPQKTPSPYRDNSPQADEFVDRVVDVLTEKDHRSPFSLRQVYGNFIKQLRKTGQDPRFASWAVPAIALCSYVQLDAVGRILESIARQLDHVLTVAFDVMEEKERYTF